jgi:hypothetical protein
MCSIPCSIKTCLSAPVTPSYTLPFVAGTEWPRGAGVAATKGREDRKRWSACLLHPNMLHKKPDIFCSGTICQVPCRLRFGLFLERAVQRGVKGAVNGGVSNCIKCLARVFVHDLPSFLLEWFFLFASLPFATIVSSLLVLWTGNGENSIRRIGKPFHGNFGKVRALPVNIARWYRERSVSHAEPARCIGSLFVRLMLIH